MPSSREASSGPILYVGGTLPALSETFVYRELFGLRDRGWTVHAASVHPPQRGLGEDRLDALADEAVPVYGLGPTRMLLDAGAFLASTPGRGLWTLARGGVDAVFGTDVTLSRRPKVLWQCLAGLALARRVRRLGVRHVHAHMAHVPATIAMYTAMALRCPFSFTGHAVDIFRERTLLAAKLRRAAFVPCISRWHREFYREIEPLPDPRLPVVRCGVSTRAAARSHDTLAGALRVLGVGRLVPKKGFDILLRAVADLSSHGIGLQTTIIGDGPERSSLEALASRLGGAVELLGARTNGEVHESLGSADLFVLPCRTDPSGDRDGIPVVLMEAMAAGVPVIAGDLPAIRELILDGRTGVLVPPENAASLAEAMAVLASDPERRRGLAEHGRAWVEEEFSLDANVGRLIQALHTALAPSPSFATASVPAANGAPG